jgi:hypothetical protein
MLSAVRPISGAHPEIAGPSDGYRHAGHCAIALAASPPTVDTQSAQWRSQHGAQPPHASYASSQSSPAPRTYGDAANASEISTNGPRLNAG